HAVQRLRARTTVYLFARTNGFWHTGGEFFLCGQRVSDHSKLASDQAADALFSETYCQNLSGIFCRIDRDDHYLCGGIRRSTGVLFYLSPARNGAADPFAKSIRSISPIGHRRCNALDYQARV